MFRQSLLALLPLPLPAPHDYSCSDVHLRAVQGQAGPEGGQLASATLPTGATLHAGGRIAFTTSITGLARNQAVMVSDGETLRAIAFGCGGAGGEGAPGSCGDPTPIGGTFAGLFAEPWHAPATNDAGDVLFLADVTGGTTSRGLFLHRASTASLQAVAWVGQTSPSGAAITALGCGTLDAGGNAVFLARTQPQSGPANEILAYDAGVLTVVAAEGTPGPDGTYDGVSSEFQLAHDGTSVPTGPLPVRDALGRVAHFGYTSTFQLHGLVLHTPGQTPAWLASFHEPTPAGGVFNTFGSPAFGPDGDVFFSAQYLHGSGTGFGIFAGAPGNLRKVIASFDPIGTSICASFDRSRNPFSWVGRDGEIVLWTRVQHQDQSFGEALVLVPPTGPIEILAEPRDPAPTGGVLAELGRFPSIDPQGRILLSARIASGPTTDAVWIVAPCGTSVTFCDGKPSSLGCEPRIFSRGRASATGSSAFLIGADTLPSRRSAILFYGPGAASTPFQGATLCVASPLRRTPAQTSTGQAPSDCTGTLAFDFGARIASGIDPALASGSTVAAQWLVRDPQDPLGFGTTLSDAIQFTIGP